MLQRQIQSAQAFLKGWNKITVQCACFHKNFRKGTSESHYDVLGVPLYSSDKEIRKAFIELSKKYHPDANANDKTLHDKFVKISRAYNVLISPEERKVYDEGLRAGLHMEPDEVSTTQNWNPNHAQYYYHPRFYQHPEMRKAAAKVWEKNTGHSYAEYYADENTSQNIRRPKNLGLKAFLASSILISLSLLVVYNQYRKFQHQTHIQRVRTVEEYERKNPGAREANAKRRAGKGVIEEKDLTEDPMAGPQLYNSPKELKT